MNVRFVIPGTPPRKNRRHIIGRCRGKPILRNAPEFDDFVDRLQLAWWTRDKICNGRVKVAVASFWPRKRNLPNIEDCGFGDVDAPVSWILDALERAGVVDNDARVSEIVASKHYDPDNPRVEVSIFCLDL